MIKQITIENFKSIATLSLELGRVNVLVGENGCGKTNILEAIALSAAAATDQLEGALLTLRGIRPSAPLFMRPLSAGAASADDTRVTFHGPDPRELPYSSALYLDTNPSSPRWALREPESEATVQMDDLQKELSSLVQLGVGPSSRRGRPKKLRSDPESVARYSSLIAQFAALARSAAERSKMGPSTGMPEALAAAAFAAGSAAFAAFGAELAARMPPAELDRYTVFSPSGAAMRELSSGCHYAPIGAHGHGLFTHLSALSSLGTGALAVEIIERARAIVAPFGLRVPGDPTVIDGDIVDAQSAGDAVLFVLLYVTLLVSPEAPSFFAVDNVDASLSPKLSAALVRALGDLADKHDKQILVTAQNPGALAGLDLTRDDQRLFVVARGEDGATACRRVKALPPSEGTLADALLSGALFTRGA